MPYEIYVIDYDVFKGWIYPPYKVLFVKVGLGVSTPLKNMSSSVGMMTFPIHMETYKNHVPVTTNQSLFPSYSH